MSTFIVRNYDKARLHKAATAGTRIVHSMSGSLRWACRACGKSYQRRRDAEFCCRAVIDPALHDQLAGAEAVPPGHRTHEQIGAQLDARMAELERQARERRSAPPCLYPCETCKWSLEKTTFDKQYQTHQCHNPLLVGFDKPQPHVDWQLAECSSFPSGNWPNAALCGREKALWEPRDDAPPEPEPLFWFQRLIKAFLP